MKERIGYIDLAAGIMTLWIILCHAYLYAGLTCLVFMQKPKQNDYLKDSYNHEDASFQTKGETACLKMTNFSITNKK